MNSGKLEIFSSGGVGDALIVGLKIQEAIKASHPGVVSWRHFEKHECHADPCLAIQSQFANAAECLIMDQPEKSAKEMCENIDGVYFDTKAGNIFNPYLDRQISPRGFFHERLLGEHNYIVVQAQAGRMNDATRREVGLNVMNQLLHMFPGKKLVILGPENHPFHTIDMSRTVNLTGQTQSITDALEVINDCVLFVGQDGVMAYYALMLKKRSVLAFHLPTLPNHYWNKRWGHHCIAMLGAGNMLKELPRSGALEQLFREVP